MKKSYYIPKKKRRTLINLTIKKQVFDVGGVRIKC